MSTENYPCRAVRTSCMSVEVSCYGARLVLATSHFGMPDSISCPNNNATDIDEERASESELFKVNKDVKMRIA